MTKGIIELNDANMGLGLDGKLVEQSSGYAVLDQKRLMVGAEALRNVKLLPRWTNNRFWHQLNTDGLSNATGSVRHHADLAFAHLEQMKSLLPCDDLIIAVPGHYDKTQLGLLLGMCKEAGLPVRALVDLSLLAVANLPSHNTAVYLDVGLHNITVSTLKSDGVLRQTAHTTLLETGLATYWDRWASLIAEQFIQSSRFDPMHEAASEQQLFDALPEFMLNIGNNRVLNFELDLGHATHSTALSKDQLLSATASAYPTIVQGIRRQVPAGEPFSLFVSPRLQHFPDLLTSLNLIPDADVVTISPSQLVENAQELWQNIVTRQDSVTHVTTLAVNQPSVATTPKQAAPTHLLVGNHAYPLSQIQNITGFTDRIEQQGDDGASLIRSGSSYVLDALNSALRVNDKSNVSNYSLQIGDQLEIAGKSARVISVN